MKIEEKCDGNVLIVEDFLTAEELTQLRTFMKDFDYENLKEHEFKYWGKRLINDHQMKLNPGYENVMDDVLPTLNNVLQRVTDILNKHDYQAEWVPSPHNLIKMFNNSSNMEFDGDDKLEMFVHIDNQGHMESPIMWGSVTYLNDEYEGGEIYYPDYEYWYKPVAGSMVLHRGNTRHGVKKVTSGERFCAASLVTIKGNWNQNPLPTRTDNVDNPYHYPAGYWGKRYKLDPIQGDIKNLRSDGSTAEYNPEPELGRADGND
jgi:hypothetical protein